MTIIQIYAFTRIDQALEAAEYGVDQVGFVAGKYNQVFGELSFSEAREMAQALHGKAVSVALTMSTSVEDILGMAQEVQPDIVHISSEPEDVGEHQLEALRIKLPESVKLMKAIPVTGLESIALAHRFIPFCDILLLDTRVQGFPGVGATGVLHDWNISQKIVKSITKPVILAGGLSSENVANSITAVQPWGVDSNTHTNLPGDRVKKDMQRIRQFVDQVRLADRLYEKDASQ